MQDLSRHNDLHMHSNDFVRQLILCPADSYLRQCADLSQSMSHTSDTYISVSRSAHAVPTCCFRIWIKSLPVCSLKMARCCTDLLQSQDPVGDCCASFLVTRFCHSQGIRAAFWAHIVNLRHLHLHCRTFKAHHPSARNRGFTRCTWVRLTRRTCVRK